jgi:hypothetical protein
LREEQKDKCKKQNTSSKDQGMEYHGSWSKTRGEK